MVKKLDEYAISFIKEAIKKGLVCKNIHKYLKETGYDLTLRAVQYRAAEIKNGCNPKKQKRRIVGVIPDTHIPFEHPGALEFIKTTFKTMGVTDIVHVGDIVDQYAFSRFGKSPESMGAKEEIEVTKEALQPWKEAFPVMKICLGNHDDRIQKLAKNSGIPLDLLIDNIFDYPDGWEVAKEFIIDGVYYTHGVNVSGVNSALNLASNMGMSAVMGHLHNQGGIKYQQLPNRTIFGMNVGCLTNDSTLNNNRPYAFDYSKDMRKRSVYGCGIVISNVEAYFIPMLEV